MRKMFRNYLENTISIFMDKLYNKEEGDGYYVAKYNDDGAGYSNLDTE